MPHSVSNIAKKRLQAIILCGPGVSFTTFASNPEEFPKALIPIANRPMVWYPLDLCNRMGIENVALIVPRSSEHSMFNALNTNAHLIALPKTPKLVAPKALEQTTGTAAIFRLPEIRELITGDFIVLPCDLVCELNGPTLLNTWMVKQPWTGLTDPSGEPKEAVRSDVRGGFTMWYDTKGENPVQGEETDFIMTTPFEKQPVSSKSRVLTSTLKLVYSMPTDTLNDITEDNQDGLPIRHSLIKKHPRLRLFTQHRDAHFYVFPSWVVDMINANDHMDSLAEDVIGWWAKAEWQDGLGKKLGLGEILGGASTPRAEAARDGAIVALPGGGTSEDWRKDPDQVVSDQRNSKSTLDAASRLVVPPIVAYVHPSYQGAPLVRRVDTASLLLSISLKMAKLGSIEQVGQAAASPFAHQTKVASKARIAWGKCNISQSDCLVGHNVRVEEKCIIKESVIGTNSHIHAGAKLTRCVLMDGVVVKKGCRLTGCIIGRKAEIGEYSTLTDCEVQDNHKVGPKTEEKKEKIMAFEGLETSGEGQEEDEELEESFPDEDEALDPTHEADD